MSDPHAINVIVCDTDAWDNDKKSGVDLSCAPDISTPCRFVVFIMFFGVSFLILRRTAYRRVPPAESAGGPLRGGSRLYPLRGLDRSLPRG